jgi:hypothetical protein
VLAKIFRQIAGELEASLRGHVAWTGDGTTQGLTEALTTCFSTTGKDDS